LIEGKFKLAYAEGDPIKVVEQLVNRSGEEIGFQCSEATNKPGSSSNELKSIVPRSPSRSQKVKKVEFAELPVDSLVIKPQEVELSVEEKDPNQEIQMEGGASEVDFSSHTSFEEEYIKEMIQEVDIKVSLYRFLLAFFILVFLFFMLATVVTAEIGQSLYKRSDWMWFNVFFGS